MAELHLIRYQWGERNLLGGRGFGPVLTSIFGEASLKHWDQMLRPYLRKGGRSVRSRWYLPFGSGQAALIWSDPGAGTGLRDRGAVVLVGPDQELTWELALTLPAVAFADLPRRPVAGRLETVPARELARRAGEEREAVAARAGQPDILEWSALLVAARWADPEAALAVRATGAPRAVLWNACRVLAALGEGVSRDTRAGFATAAGHDRSGPLPALTLWPPGSRSPGLGDPPRVVEPATRLPGASAARYLLQYHRTHGGVSLRQLLDQHGVLDVASSAERIRRVWELWEPAVEEDPVDPAAVTVELPLPGGGHLHAEGPPETVGEAGAGPVGPREPHGPTEGHPTPPDGTPPPITPREETGTVTHPPRSAGTEDGVLCPICLSRVTLDRDALFAWRDGTHQPLRIPPDATPAQRERMLRWAQVRCPNRGASVEEHHLPYRYVDSDPVVITFVGSSASGKTHLLAAMIGAVERGDLAHFGLSAEPLDLRQHEEFLATKVRPLLDERRVLQRTRSDIRHAEAGLLVGPAPRAVALFDVQGEDLSGYSRAEQRTFLEAVHGLVFVIDPDQLDSGAAMGDPAFSTILNLLPDPEGTAAALVLTKADRLRFDYPVDRWLRRPATGLDAEEFLQESEDIYAYLYQDPRTRPWLRPYSVCRRATVHVASATGGPVNAAGDRFARPVRPRRVLEPLLALLAMTGAIDSDEARKVGR